MEKQYRNIGFVFLLLIPMAILGFYKSYIIRSPDISIVIDGYIHFHALVSSLWIGLLISQPLLIRNKKYQLHRLFGKLSYLIFPLLILSFVPLIVRNFNGIASVINPVFDAGLLLLFYPLAIKNKRKISYHMRYMVATTLIFIGPTLARILIHWTDIRGFWIPLITWGSINLILVGLIFFDKKNKRDHKPYLVALAGFSVYLIVLLLRSYYSS